MKQHDLPDGMWIRDNVLYVDNHRQAAPAAPKRGAHKMAEWKPDWWLGKTVVRGPQVWFVAGAEPHRPAPLLVLESEDGHIEKVSLVVANKALRTGDWSLL